MFLKPKSATHKTQGLLYRRYTDIAESFVKGVAYQTEDGKLWTFNSEKKDFEETSHDLVKKTISVFNETSKFSYGGAIYNYINGKWHTATGNALANLQFNNIAKYQTNKYYYAGTFSFAVRGTIEGSETQPVKGNIVPLVSFTIKYYDDDINLDHDDLVVIGNHLFSVENPVWSMKLQPKPYKIYFATLNSIK